MEKSLETFDIYREGAYNKNTTTGKSFSEEKADGNYKNVIKKCTAIQKTLVDNAFFYDAGSVL